MKLKNILEPTPSKITIFIILVFITSVFNLASSCPGCTRAAYGLPLALYELPGCEPMPETSCPDYRISHTGLVIDLILWYLVSCVIVTLVKQQRKKNFHVKNNQ